MSQKGVGFTLLELLVVIGIIGILAAMGTLVYARLTLQGRDARRRSDVQTVAQAIDQYYLINDQVYPPLGNCSGVEEYLQDGRMPVDPQNSGTLTYDWTNACESASNRYCVCALMEVAGSGNANARTDGQCDFQAGGDYFCVGSKQ